MLMSCWEALDSGSLQPARHRHIATSRTVMRISFFFIVFLPFLFLRTVIYYHIQEILSIKYIYVEQNLSKKISVLENAGSTKAAALMQMIIEEIQLRQANYRYTVSTLAFNLVLFFDRLDNENIKFQNNSRETSDYTRKIISYIELHYMEDIGGKDFARACNLSETHMRRIFIESANITPSEYLNLVRIKKACEMLAKEKCSIEKVSNSVGYPVISTFMRNFKKITGISPNAWRRKALENPENVAAYQVSVFKGW